MKFVLVVLLIASSFALSGCLLEPWRPGYDHDVGSFGGLCRGGQNPATGEEHCSK
jgi:hypothetical protein